ncbi:HlyD family type I secretion periplasmic adaptor subunit [Roseateles sp. P5_E8]
MGAVRRSVGAFFGALFRPSKSLGLDPDALDFAPDLLAIQERPPSRLPRALLLTVAALVLLLLVWASFARLDIVASAEGRLVPLTFTKVVQPAEAGVVKEILVKDGDLVKAGQVLLRMDARLSQADTTALTKDVAMRRLNIRRIDAEIAERSFIRAKDEPIDLFLQMEGQYRAHRQAYLDSVAQEREMLGKAKADLSGAQQVLIKLTQTLPTYKQSAEAYRRLVQEGFVGELAANEKTREVIEKEQDLKTQAANVESLNASIAQSGRRITALRSQYSAQLEAERSDTLTQLNRSSQELAKSHVKAGMLEITAPTEGVVKDVGPSSAGTVVAAGALLMNIVPKDEPLQAEVLLKNEDVGFVAVGQNVRVKVAAYPFQKYGLLEGNVQLVSADAADPKQQQQGAQAAGLTYRAIISLKSTKLVSAATGDFLPLSPGMLITAEVHQGSRSVLEYLLSPVTKVRQEAARER